MSLAAVVSPRVRLPLSNYVLDVPLRGNTFPSEHLDQPSRLQNLDFEGNVRQAALEG